VLAAPLDGGELLFDPERVRAHVLNVSADAIWQRCDGGSTVDEIVASITIDDPNIDLRREVDMVIDHLGAEGLLLAREGAGTAAPNLASAPVAENATANRFANVPHTGEPAAGLLERSWPHRSGPFRGLDFRFTLSTDDEDFGRYIGAILAPLDDRGERPAIPVGHYTVGFDHQAPMWIVALDGFVVGRGTEPSAAAALLLWHVNQMVSTTSSDLLQLHASAITAHGMTIAFPASMNSGKSTLVTALVDRGYGYVTDETVGIEPETGIVRPYPKAIALDPGSWRLFPQHERVGSGGEPRFAHRKWHLDPTAIGGTIAEPAPLGLVLFPRFTPGSTTTLNRLDVAPAALELAQNSFNLGAVGQRGVDAIAKIAPSVPCYRLVFDDLDEAVAAITDVADDVARRTSAADQPRRPAPRPH
jgi:hypothetical protein